MGLYSMLWLFARAICATIVLGSVSTFFFSFFYTFFSPFLAMGLLYLAKMVTHDVKFKDHTQSIISPNNFYN